MLHCAPRILVHGASRRPGDEPSFAGGMGGRFGGTIIGDPASGTACTLGTIDTYTSGGGKRSESGLRFGFGGRRAKLFDGRSSAHSLGLSCNMRELSSSGASHSFTRDSLDEPTKEWASNRADSIGGVSLGCSFGMENDFDRNEHLNATPLNVGVNFEQRKKSIEKVSMVVIEEKIGEVMQSEIQHQHQSLSDNRNILPMHLREENEFFEVEEEGLTAQHVAEDVAVELQMQASEDSIRGLSRPMSASGSCLKSKAGRAAERRRQHTRLGIRLARFLDAGRLGRPKDSSESKSKRKRCDVKLI